MGLDQLPDHLLLEHVCGFVHLQDRWHGLARVSKRWRHLALASVHHEQHVDLSVALYGPRVTSPLLSHLVKGLGSEQLRHVDVESKQISDNGLEQLRHCVRLQTLALHCIKLTDEPLLAISRTCLKLTKVDLSGCSRVRDEGIIAIAANCPSLAQINLTMCHRITDRSVVALAQHSSLTLEEVVLDRCLKVSGPSLRFLMRVQRNIRSLSFARCPKVQGADFYSLTQTAQTKAIMSNCALTSLDLSGCAALDDRGVAVLVATNRHTLRFLNLGALQTLGCATFAEISRCAKLQSLNLSLCRTLANNDVVAIASGCTKLSTLLLQGCVALDDAGLQAMAHRAMNLQRLSLEFCYNITDAGLTTVALHCPKLLHLNIKACNQLTVQTFRALVRRKNPLETLYIGACADMDTTATYFSIVKRKFPRCRIHWV
ncbi:hypothetical protein BBO99_00005601 [Phytophthora kernoviae]|uniref:F-box/LRR-repeat protein 15-like leucin rich repeat domain-containing protein n=2 Tax=Phytophthora kernoviae TaxID=325452 RepID=A0A3R7NF92_9STRA|nr:hypothetical protein G195_006469 [Phytophthora kernoviae 00238/432]KAG2523002.1 hypothetical protein JM16_005561 [Phytophthora kernoviae]KAG2524693.1 hypothetical protein JM18_005294 [Phytophthora kernoviae]RLN38217.1 hypothetical protein BBI17_005937 [Phytophthora kernoviae]RLN78952.1 hypothetical protein BBO99_00005601 [Phytophthora kernoviae]